MSERPDQPRGVASFDTSNWRDYYSELRIILRINAQFI
jgi:hypothetical protein